MTTSQFQEDDSAPSTKNNRGAYKKALLYIAIWLFMVLVFFSPAVFAGKLIAPLDCIECLYRPVAHRPIEETHNQFVADGISQYIPYKQSIEQSWKQDGYVGWNPYTHNGNAIPENTMTSPGDLLNILYAFLPFWSAWDITMILQFFIAGLGMILLLKHCKLPWWAALLGAVSFAFYSQFILWMYHKWVGAMMWAPFLAWALLRFKQHFINVPAIIFMALAWRSGHLQACTFAFILVACMWVAEIWKKDGRWLNRRDFIRLTLSYFLTGALGALLSLDYFVDTLVRMGGCKDMPFTWGIENLFSIPGMLFPSIMGTPQTHDVGRVMRLGLFEIQFGGALMFILALVGFFNKRAPLTAKVIFVGSFLLACTPLRTYIYNRSTVICAMGMAWLAVWQLHDFTQTPFKSAYLKRIGYTLAIIITLWLLASLLMYCFRDSLVLLMKAFVNKATTLPSGRVRWQEIRVERFFDQMVLWYWKNLLFAGCMLLGIFCCYKIKPGSNNKPWLAGIILITYTELLLFSSSWITYHNRPEGDYIYNTPSWIPELKNHMKDGSLAAVRTSTDKDFWCNNQFSAFGIRLAHGYETFQPKYLKPLATAQYHPADYAMAGISHLLVDTKWRNLDIPGWIEVMKEDDFKVLANPEYKGRYFVDDSTALNANWRTCNRIHLTVPADSRTLTVLESYHKGWKAYAGEQELQINPTERYGMQVSLPEAHSGCDVLLEFHMPYRKLYYTIMLVTALGLLLIVLKQKRIF